MRTIIYVDGFNLYFRLLQKRPALKWLDIKALAQRVLRPANQIVAVRYYTARVSGRLNPLGPARQQIYLDALATVREVSIHMGMFLNSEKFAGLVHPPQFRPTASLPQPWPDVVKVLKVEERGATRISPVTCSSTRFRAVSTWPRCCRTTAIWSNQSESSPRRWASRSAFSRPFRIRTLNRAGRRVSFAG